jgi:DNA-binding NarL/FixJ family response regulator
MSIRVAIMDDHPLILHGLQNMLEESKDIAITGTYNKDEDLLTALKKERPDVLLLDIQMPGMPGNELATIITGLYPDIKIIALSNLDTIYYVKLMFEAGVSGYVLKTSAKETILEAIRTVYTNGQFIEPSLQEILLQVTLNRPGRRQQIQLTKREKEILQLVAVNYTSQEIADKLFLSKRTIDNHRNNLLLKLDARNTAELIKKSISLKLL